MDNDDRQDLVRKLFALLTMKFEDDAAMAADGQGPRQDQSVQRDLASRLIGIASEVAVLAEAITAILPEV